MFQMQFQTPTTIFQCGFVTKFIKNTFIFSSFVVKSNYVLKTKGLLKQGLTVAHNGGLAGAAECPPLPLALLGVEATHPLEGTSTECGIALFLALSAWYYEHCFCSCLKIALDCNELGSSMKLEILTC